jgi:hypothetical protein
VRRVVAYRWGMDMPTAAEVRSWSPPAFDWAAAGFPDTVDGNALLDVRIEWSVGTLYAVTARTLESIPAVGKPEETSIAQQVIAAFTIIEAMGGSEEALEVMGQPWLKSFTAGSYSETRFSVAEMSGSSGTSKSPPYPPQLWTLLWALMTPDKQDEWMWLLNGQRKPEGVLVEGDWSSGLDSPYGPFVWGSSIEHWG